MSEDHEYFVLSVVSSLYKHAAFNAKLCPYLRLNHQPFLLFELVVCPCSSFIKIRAFITSSLDSLNKSGFQLRFIIRTKSGPTALIHKADTDGLEMMGQREQQTVTLQSKLYFGRL